MSNEPAKTIGRYQILEELGRGAMGIVYKGHDPVIGRTVALKTIAIRDDSEMPDLRQRLYREACAAGTLTHPNIVTVYDVIEEEGVTAVAMEFVEGETLKDVIDARAPMHVEVALDLFEQIAAALDYAGNRNVVHRDIKPANIMVTFDGRAKVADFGLARVGGSTMTKTSTILGTPGYMSPEQVRGMPLDGRSDLFSAAVVLYEMLTRQKIFAGKDLGDTLARIIRKPVPLATQFNPALNPAVAAVLDRALSKEADQRFATGAELVKTLRNVTKTEALPTMAIPDAVDPEAKTIMMLPRSALAVTAAATAAVAKPPATVRVPPKTRQVTVAPVVDPDLRHEHAPPTQTVAAPSSRGLMVAIAVSAVVLGGVAVGVVMMLRNQQAPAATAPGATPATAVPGTESKPPTAVTRANEPANPPASAPADVSRPPSAAKNPVRGTPQRPVVPADGPAVTPLVVETPKPAPPATATLQLQYDGAPYPLSLVADGRTIGRVSEGQTSVTVDAGRLHLRAVNEQFFLDHDLGAVSLTPGERRTLTIPATAVVVIGVRGENYTGLRILLDGKPLAGPYPAQLPRIAASTHKIEFRWSDGALQGVTIADTIDLSNGRQFTIRAVPEGAQVAIQRLR